MMAELLLKDSTVPYSYAIQSKYTYIGHGINCNVRLYGINISPVHCVIVTLRGTPPIIRNMSVTSMTLLNDVNIGTEDHTLKNNDVITVGGVKFLWNTNKSFKERKRKIKRLAITNKSLTESYYPTERSNIVVGKLLTKAGLLCRVLSNTTRSRNSLRSLDVNDSLAVVSPVQPSGQMKRGAKVCFSHSTPAPYKCKLNSNSVSRTPFSIRKMKMSKNLTDIREPCTSNPLEKTDTFNFSFSPIKSKSSVKKKTHFRRASKKSGSLQKSLSCNSKTEDASTSSESTIIYQCKVEDVKNNLELVSSDDRAFHTSQNENRLSPCLQTNCTPTPLSLNSTLKKPLAQTSSNIISSKEENSLTPSCKKSILKRTDSSVKNEEILCTPKSVKRPKEINFRSPRNSSFRLENIWSPSSTPKKAGHFKKLAFSEPRKNVTARKQINKRIIDALCLEKSAKAASKLKSEPQKALDKKKVAALIVCHRKKSPSKQSDVSNELSSEDNQNKSRISAPELPLSNGSPVDTSIQKKQELLRALDLTRKSNSNEILDKPSVRRRLRSSSKNNSTVAEGKLDDFNSQGPVTHLLKLADKKIEGIFNTSPQASTNVKNVLPLPTVSHMDRVYTTSTVVDYTDVSGVKKLFTPSPKGDYTNPMGIKELFAVEKSSYLNIQGVRELFSVDSPHNNSEPNINKTSVVNSVKPFKRVSNPINDDSNALKRRKIEDELPMKKNPRTSSKKVTFQINTTHNASSGQSSSEMTSKPKEKRNKNKPGNNPTRYTEVKNATKRNGKKTKTILDAHTSQNNSDQNCSLKEINLSSGSTKESNEQEQNTTNNEKEIESEKNVNDSTTLTTSENTCLTSITSSNQPETTQKKKKSSEFPKISITKHKIKKSIKKMSNESIAKTSKVAKKSSNRTKKNSKAQTPVNNKKTGEYSSPKSLNKAHSPKTRKSKKVKPSENFNKKIESLKATSESSQKTSSVKGRSLKKKQIDESFTKIEFSQQQSPNVSGNPSNDLKKRSSLTPVIKLRLRNKSARTKNKPAEDKTRKSIDSARTKNKKLTVKGKTKTSNDFVHMKIKKLSLQDSVTKQINSACTKNKKPLEGKTRKSIESARTKNKKLPVEDTTSSNSVCVNNEKLSKKSKTRNSTDSASIKGKTTSNKSVHVKSTKLAVEDKTKNSNDNVETKIKKSSLKSKTRTCIKEKKQEVENVKANVITLKTGSLTAASRLTSPTKLVANRRRKPSDKLETRNPKQKKTNSNKSATKCLEKKQKSVKTSPLNSRKTTGNPSPRKTRSKTKIELLTR